MTFPSTFSVVAVAPATGEIGIAVQSKFLSVGAVVPWVRCGAGAIASQAFANTSYGPRALDLLAKGAHPSDIAGDLIADDCGREDRQFGIVDMQGRAATFTGANCIFWAGVVGEAFAVQGNCLAGSSVVTALEETMRDSTARPSSTPHRAYRFIASLRAAQAEGGDKRGQQSAALIIEKQGGGYAGFNDRYVDLRVDDHARPIEELARLLELHKLYFFAPEPEDIYPIDAAMRAEIDREIHRVRAASLLEFMRVENLENRLREDGCIDRQTLEYLRSYNH
ncbi:MAG: DUF1028 domain-containing protein [Candidatus Eremiobacteraeota bacterium]|nr:DUF1028 domain-containing protein [Candidatus Eremiobacteraeota bacterium]